MNKRHLIIACCLLLTLTSCEKFLERPPDNRTRLDSPEKIAQLLANAYPKANYMAFAESISDNAVDRSNGAVDPTNRDPFFFEDVNSEDQDSPEYYWNACYEAISAANHALEAIAEAPDGNRYRAQQGEALVARAYAHFMLVTFFARYDATLPGAGTDPGVPYVTKAEKVVFGQYSRGTVKEVYDNIEKDLLAGLPLITDQAYTVPKYHFTRAAAHAFAARFYLFKKEYAKVVEHASQAVPGNLQASLRPWNTSYRNLTLAELITRYYRGTEPANLLLCETSSWWGRGSSSDARSSFAHNRYGMDVALQAQVFRSPVSGGAWAFGNQTYYSGNSYFIPKVYENFTVTNITANSGYGYVMVPLFTAEEALFNRAEAHAMLGNTAAVLQDLNTYASTRINNYNPASHTITEAKVLAYYNTADLAAGLVRAILDFKRAEYMHEGMRWLDLLRHKLPVTHREMNGSTVVKTMTLAADDNRRVFQIPASAKLAGLALNPR